MPKIGRNEKVRIQNVKDGKEKTIKFLNDYSKSVRFKVTNNNNPIILN